MKALGDILARAVEAWRAFWFTPADPVVLGFIRLCTGLVLLYVLLASGPLLAALYGPEGWLDQQTADVLRKETPWVAPPAGWNEEGPPEVVRPEARRLPEAPGVVEHWGVDPAWTVDLGQPLFSPFYHLRAGQMVLVHGLAVLIALLFTLGIGTRVASVLAWVAALSYAHRNPPSLFGQDTILAILLLYLMIGPAGAALSVDRLVTRWRLRRLGLPETGPAPSASANLAIRLMQVHFCIIYLLSGLSKMQGAAWWNGTAIWQTLTNYEFAPAQFEAFTGLLRVLARNRWVWELFHWGGSLSTLVLEVSLPFLIWRRRWRWLLICAAVGLHTFIALAMGLVAFSGLMIVLVFAFVPPPALHAFLDGVRRVVRRRETPVAQPQPAEVPAGVAPLPGVATTG